MAATVEQKVHRLIQSVTLVKCDEYGEAGAFSDAFIILTHWGYITKMDQSLTTLVLAPIIMIGRHVNIK